MTIRNFIKITMAVAFLVGIVTTVTVQAEDFFSAADKAAKAQAGSRHIVAVTNAETGEKTYYEATEEQYQESQKASKLPEGDERDAAIAEAMKSVTGQKALPKKSVAEGDCDESTGACYYSYYYYPTSYYYAPTIVVYRPVYRPVYYSDYYYYSRPTSYYSYSVSYTRTVTISYSYRTTYTYSWYSWS